MSQRVRKSTHGVSFVCPGCGDTHHVPTTGSPSWGWNGALDKPTLSPSILVTSGHYASGYVRGESCWCSGDYPFKCYRCHSHVVDGEIRFEADCSHPLTSQTVSLPEVTQ